MSNLLRDFVENMQDMRNGQTFNIRNENKRYLGALYYVMGDTPATQYVGGFKESVGLAEKPCRTCEIKHDDLNNSRFGNQFRIRDEAEHRDRCDIIESLRGETRRYWSKYYGISSRSILCNVPEFELTKCILHDPMHVLLEGIVKMELQLMLHVFIDKKNYFSLRYLNNIIKNFNYTDDELQDKPQELEKKSLDTKKTFPMTAVETKHFMILLPFMIGDKVPEDDQIWINFLRLLQITLLVLSPMSSSQCIDSLSQLIASHNHNFRELFPDVSFTPKLQFLSHLPMQIMYFGPGRNHWCIRLEAKHGLFKNKKWKNFKCIAKSIAFYHQRWMCLQQTGSLTEKSEVFLYRGDQTKDGMMISSCDLTLDIRDCILKFENALPVEMLSTCSMNIKSIVYRIGSVLIVHYSEEDLQFAVINNIYVVNQAKYFELAVLTIDEYNSHLHCFACQKTNNLIARAAVDILYKWPQKSHFIIGTVHVMLQNVDFSWS